jgi:uncharacterized membrane protein
MSYLLFKWLHIVGATLLLGTGAGIAFFLCRAHRTRDPRLIAVVAADVVRADLWFTATAVVLQPVTGLMLLAKGGWSVSQSWLWQSILVYGLVGCCWLPVVPSCRRHTIAAIGGGSCLAGRGSPACY